MTTWRSGRRLRPKWASEWGSFPMGHWWMSWRDVATAGGGCTWSLPAPKAGGAERRRGTAMDCLLPGDPHSRNAHQRLLLFLYAHLIPRRAGARNNRLSCVGLFCETLVFRQLSVGLIFNSCGHRVGRKLLISLNPTGCDRDNVVPRFGGFYVDFCEILGDRVRTSFESRDGRKPCISVGKPRSAAPNCNGGRRCAAGGSR